LVLTLRPAELLLVKGAAMHVYSDASPVLLQDHVSSCFAAAVKAAIKAPIGSCKLEKWLLQVCLQAKWRLQELLLLPTCCCVLRLLLAHLRCVAVRCCAWPHRILQ
jgi:hypothetical protein